MSPPRTRSRRGEGDKLKEEILAAAEDLLARTSDRNAVSIRAVSEAVGVTPPSIYRHFDDKRSLLAAVCRRHFDALLERMATMVEDRDDPVEALRAIGRAYLDWGVEHPEEYRIMFMARPEPGDIPDQYEDAVGTGTAFGLLVGIVRDCMEAGQIREGDAFETAYALFTLVHGVTSQAIANDLRFFPGSDPRRILELLMDATTEGMRPR